MERQLDPAASAVLVRTLAGLGVAVHLDALAAVGGRADDDGVTLRPGRRRRADAPTCSCSPAACGRDRAGPRGRAGRRARHRRRRPAAHQRPGASPRSATAPSTTASVVRPGRAGLGAGRGSSPQVLTGADPLARYRPLPGGHPAQGGRHRPGRDGRARAGRRRVEELSFADPARGTYAKLRHRAATGWPARSCSATTRRVGTVIQLFDRGAPVPADRRALLLGRAVGGAGRDAGRDRRR